MDLRDLLAILWLFMGLAFVYSYFYARYKKARESHIFKKILKSLRSEQTGMAFDMLRKAELDWFVNTYRGTAKVYIQELQMLKLILEYLGGIANGAGSVVDMGRITNVIDSLINICGDKSNKRFFTLGDYYYRYDYTCWLKAEMIGKFEQLEQELAEAREIFRMQLNDIKFP
jgi:hypothetical protein